MTLPQLFNKFVADKRVDEVSEILKKCDDIFHIIRPTEVQHSTILAWLFNPREGHGQGDAILKDFLIAAYHASEEHVLSNRSFFDHWSPSRIARTGFHGICLFPEFALGRAGRLDLLMVDFDNEVMIVVENKHGARYSADQLEGYYTGVASMLRQRPVFSGFRTVHIALDRNFRRRQGDSAPATPLNRWAYVDYQWLQRGARRAELQLNRGDRSASLVTAYCQRQTDYEPPELGRASDMLAELVREYRPLVESFAKARKLALGSLTPTGINDDVWVYAHHNQEMVDRLAKLGELAFLEPKLRSTLPAVPVEAYYGKGYVNLFPVGWQPLADPESWGPLRAQVWVADTASDGSEQFGLALYYCAENCRDEYLEALGDALKATFPELDKGRQVATYRTLGHTKSVSESTMMSRLRELLEAGDTAVRSVLA